MLTIASAVAAQQLTNAQAAATANVEKQVQALEDSTAMIKAQESGTEAATAAAIAYRNAIDSGADSSAAAALSTATMANYSAKNAAAADQAAQAWANMATQAVRAEQAAQEAEAAANQAIPGDIFSPLKSNTIDTGVTAISPTDQFMFSQAQGMQSVTTPTRLRNPGCPGRQQWYPGSFKCCHGATTAGSKDGIHTGRTWHLSCYGGHIGI